MQELFVQKLNAYVKSIGTSPSSIAYFTADNFNDRLQIDSNLWGQYCVTPTSFAGESWAVAETSKTNNTNRYNGKAVDTVCMGT